LLRHRSPLHLALETSDTFRPVLLDLLSSEVEANVGLLVSNELKNLLARVAEDLVPVGDKQR
jgi:hypothetical protein